MLDNLVLQYAPICTILSVLYLGSYPRLHSIRRQKHLLSKNPPTILCSQSRSLTEILDLILQPRDMGNPSKMSSYSELVKPWIILHMGYIILAFMFSQIRFLLEHPRPVTFPSDNSRQYHQFFLRVFYPCRR